VVALADVLLAHRTGMRSIRLNHPGPSRRGPAGRNTVHVFDDIQRVSDVVSTEIETVGIDRMSGIDLVTVHGFHGLIAEIDSFGVIRAGILGPHAPVQPGRAVRR
jgi:hypothetical protein